MQIIQGKKKFSPFFFVLGGGGVQFGGGVCDETEFHLVQNQAK